ncbi:MAG: hypothetical protein GOP50_08930 [Candidatus Heimdallarchaeota archaeon]|nr:hypothetical protein [Candidatus Heimdallarchaeota archaeon]
MYETKIPGTRYSIALMNVKGQWMLQIKLDNIIEADVGVKDLSERGIHENIKTVVSEVNLYLNDFMLDQITKEITEQANILFKEVSATAAVSTQHSTQTTMSAVEETLIQIVKRMESLEERIKRLEERQSNSV